MPKVQKVKKTKKRNNPAAIKKRSRLYNSHVLTRKINDRIRYIRGKIRNEGENVSYSNKITFFTELIKIVEAAKSSDLTLFDKIYNILDAEKEKNKSLNSEIEKLRSELEQKKRNYEVLKRIHDAHQDAMGVQLNELNDLRDENNNLRYWISVLETGIELLQETTGVTIMNLN